MFLFPVVFETGCFPSPWLSCLPWGQLGLWVQRHCTMNWTWWAGAYYSAAVGFLPAGHLWRGPERHGKTKDRRCPERHWLLRVWFSYWSVTDVCCQTWDNRYVLDPLAVHPRSHSCRKIDCLRCKAVDWKAVLWRGRHSCMVPAAAATSPGGDCGITGFHVFLALLVFLH